MRRTDPDAYQKKQARLVEQSNHSAHNAYLDSLRAQEHARLLALRGPALSQNFPQGAISNPITIMEQAISRLPPPGLFIPSHDYANAAPISVEEQARKLELSKTMWGTKQPNPTSARSTARVPPAVPFTLPTSVQPVLNPLTPVAVPNTGLGPAPITWDAKRIDEITKTFKLRRKQDVDADGAAHTASTEDGNSSSPQREAAVENGTMASQPADRGGDDSSPGVGPSLSLT